LFSFSFIFSLPNMRGFTLLLLLAFVCAVAAEIHYKETFSPDWKERWVVSDWKKSDGTAGTWVRTSGDWYGDKEAAEGIQTSQDARFYAISSKMAKPFSNVGKDLVVQFAVKHPQGIDCGGGYIKLLPADVEQKHFNGEAPYDIMFGPDVCGTSTKRVHVIFNYKGKNHLIKKDIKCETDKLTHVYTLIVRPDQTYEVQIDGDKKESGSLLEDWDFLPAKTIKDPSVSKPADWVDDAQMDDPADTKPADWDNTPKQIPDPEAEKPEDWDDEADGEWEAPQIDNPEYKGEWKPKKIANPSYKGKWVHPEIPNPEYTEDKTIAAYTNIGAVGFELWQVKAGSIFDDILVTDSAAEAKAYLDATWGKNHAAEKQMFDDAEKAKQAKDEADRKKAEDDKKSADAAKKADEDDDDDDDEEKKKSHDEL